MTVIHPPTPFARDPGCDLLAAGVVAVSPAALALAGEHPLAGQVRDFLADQEFAGKAVHTIRAYRGDLAQLAQH